MSRYIERSPNIRMAEKIDETSQNKAHLFTFKNSIQKNKTLINVHKPTNCSTFQVCLSRFLSKIKKKENKKHPITKHKILIVPDLIVKYQMLKTHTEKR